MKSCLSLLMLCVLAGAALAQFGQNKVQYVSHSWSYIQTAQFDIYFNEDGYDLAVFAAHTADSSYAAICDVFNHQLSPDERVPLIVYKSHNEFESTNISESTPGESTGGFTEFFKNRVVVPFEGSWEDFRHVIHHELTHAVMLRMIYGSQILTGMSRFQLPLWFIEGLAEYTSRHGWNREANMYLADAVLYGYLPDIVNLSYTMPYQGGQSVLCYLEERYGRDKIGELLNRVKSMHRMEGAVEHTFGIDLEQLSQEWQLHLKRNYWPLIAEKQTVSELAFPITDHLERKNYVNSAPAVSPSGERVAYLTDRNGYFDIYLYHISEPERTESIVTGQRSSRFEELHWLNPGISWSPDGEHIAFCSKGGAHDMIHVLDVARKKVIQSRIVPWQGAFAPAWSPAGDLIAFVGLRDGQSDIFIWDRRDDTLRNLTRDIFSDFDPSWSPDGRRLAFASDRRDADQNLELTELLSTADFSQTDLFALRLDDGELQRLTDTPWNETMPIWLDAENLLYVADRDGISNLYSFKTGDGDQPPTGVRVNQLTDVLTGVFQPSVSRSSHRLAFSGYQQGGYDLFLLEDYSALLSDAAPIAGAERFPFQRTREEQTATPETLSYGSPIPGGYEHYDFSSLGFRDRELGASDSVNDTLVFMDADRNFIRNDYKLIFTIDAVEAQAIYSQYFGLQGSSVLMLSDLLGNHRFYLSLDLYDQIQFTNFQLYYEYLQSRPTYHTGIFRNLYAFYAGADTVFRDNYYGLNFQMSWPFSRFTRVELRNRLFNVNRQYWDIALQEVDSHGYPIYHDYQNRGFLIPSLRLVKDNIIWGYTGPANGFRGYLNYSLGRRFTFGGETWGVNFQTLTCDLRRYFLLNRDYQFALRFGAGRSWGEEPQHFYLGGMRNWINYHYAPVTDNDAVLLTGMESIYLSEFIFPLRGTRYYERLGDTYAIANIEFRFPLLRYLQLGWPLRIGISNLRGVIFLDTGQAWRWNNSNYLRDTEERLITEDLLVGYGWGARLNLGYFLLKMDAAWRFDYDTGSSSPLYTFSLGTDF